MNASKRHNTSHAAEWHHFNDAHVQQVDEDSVITDKAYVIFLVRCSDPQAVEDDTLPVVMPHQTVTAPEFWPHKVSRTNSDLANLLPGRVGSGAAVASTNPRSAILCDDSSSEGNPRSAILPSSESSPSETPSLLSGFTGNLAALHDTFGCTTYPGLSFELDCPAKDAFVPQSCVDEWYAGEDAVNVANVPPTFAKKELQSFENVDFASVPGTTAKLRGAGRRRTKYDCC